jgi:hypothetical protein
MIGSDSRLLNVIAACEKLDDAGVSLEQIRQVDQYSAILMGTVPMEVWPPDEAAGLSAYEVALYQLCWSTMNRCATLICLRDSEGGDRRTKWATGSRDWAVESAASALGEWREARIAAELHLHGKVSAKTLIATAEQGAPARTSDVALDDMGVQFASSTEAAEPAHDDDYGWQSAPLGTLNHPM